MFIGKKLNAMCTLENNSKMNFVFQHAFFFHVSVSLQSCFDDKFHHFCSLIAKNCAEFYKSGERTSRVFTIDPDGSGAFDVFCDQTTAGGGWTVFQKRLDGSVDFYRGWADYKNGFGNLNGEFWLGLDKIHRLTNAAKNRLRVDLEDRTGKTAYAEYHMFAVTSERTKYKLSLGSYWGKFIYSIISYFYIL